MKKKSFINKTVQMLGIQTLLLIIVIVIFLFSSYRNIVENMDQLIENVTQILGNELENKIDNGDRLLEQLVYNNTEYQMLDSSSDAERYYASMKLKNLIDESMISDKNIDMIVIASNSYESCIDAESNRITSKEKEEIRKYALECASHKGEKAEWRIEKIGDTPFVFKKYVWNGKVAAVFMKVDNFMDNAANSELKDMMIFLTDHENRIQGYYGKDGEQFQNAQSLNLDYLGVHQQKYKLANGEILLYTSIGMPVISKQMRNTMLVFLFVLVCLLGFSVLLIRYIRKEILIPMRDMQKSMEQIQEGSYELRINEEYHTQEFSVLKSTFNQLMDEIVGLKIKSYEKQIELNEAELKTIKLQIRPHFFLNALTTISSLSMQNRNAEIKVYIEALVKNVRYMFKSGLHTVSLNEEIQHVENYFEMQELKYPGCVFHYIEMEPEVAEWKIPQMLIHTIVENEYKYAVSIDQMLTILIKTSKTVKNGEEMLLIEIEDDGKGYPEDVLLDFEKDDLFHSASGERVGLKSVKKMMELMYDQKELFMISNLIPHGCINRFYVPKEPIHEVKN